MKFQLKPDNRNAPDEELLEDLRRVAQDLRIHSVKMRDYNGRGRFHSETIARRFGGWNEALDRAGLKLGRQLHISDAELIADVGRVAQEVAPDKLTQRVYDENGKYTSVTISERLGWNRVLTQLNLPTTCWFDLSEKELFENLQAVWLTLGRQPGKRDMVKPLSQYSNRPYLTRFGTWRNALEAFVEYVNTDQSTALEPIKTAPSTPFVQPEGKFCHKTKRDISDRLKVRVLIRDGNRCSLCGVVVTGADIHFDHIKPWSKGGETVFENIQVLCAKHNLAKGDYYEEE